MNPSYKKHCVESLKKRKKASLRRRFIWARCAAKVRGVEFKLTFEEFYSLWEKQKGKSAYTGAWMSVRLSRGYKKRRYSVSIDRIKPDGIYELSNVVLCRYEENQKKYNTPLTEIPGDWYLNLEKLLGKEAIAKFN